MVQATSGTETVTIETVGNLSFNLNCSGSGGSSGISTVNVEAYRNLQGIVADGYISNSSVLLIKMKTLYWMTMKQELLQIMEVLLVV